MMKKTFFTFSSAILIPILYWEIDYRLGIRLIYMMVHGLTGDFCLAAVSRDMVISER